MHGFLDNKRYIGFFYETRFTTLMIMEIIVDILPAAASGEIRGKLSCDKNINFYNPATTTIYQLCLLIFLQITVIWRHYLWNNIRKSFYKIPNPQNAFNHSTLNSTFPFHSLYLGKTCTRVSSFEITVSSILCDDFLKTRNILAKLAPLPKIAY